MTYIVTPENLEPLRLNDTDPVHSVLQNVAIILSTWKNTVPLYREFGLSSEFMHKPLPVARAMLQSEIREAVEQFEPRVEVVGVQFNQGIDHLIPIVEVSIIG